MAEIATWPDAEFAFQIEYSREAFESIRRSAMQGLMDLPKIGLGVGGVLLGEREGQRITILESFELPCSHAFGPSFSLTAAELTQARALIANEEAARVVGWYCSKGVRPLELTDSDRTLLAALFPEPWQIGLLVQPHMVRPARIAFFSLNGSGDLLQGAQGELEEWREDPPPAPAAERAPLKVEAVKIEPVKVPAPDPFLALVTDADKRQDARWRRLGWAAGAVLLAVAGAAGFFYSRNSTPAPPPPPLVLHLTDANGTLVIRWNGDAVQGLDHAEMFINDGGRGREITLDRLQLSAGELRYVRKSARVTATMAAGKAQAETSFAAPSPAP